MLKKMMEPMDSSQHSLEARLLQFFIFLEIIWAGFNMTYDMLVGMPSGSVLAFTVLFVGLIVFCALGYFLHLERAFAEIYFVLAVITIPLLWYFCGGNQASANVLFVCELVLFTMCLSGVKRNVYILISLSSTSIIYVLTSRIPDIVTYPMTEEQIKMGGTGIGASTSLLITFLLIKQKKEYMKERDRAVESEQELEKSNKLQKNFLANMSHEIRSPLGIVLGFNSLIAETDDIEQIHDYAENINKAGRTLQTVINDILDYSKIESGKLDIIEADYFLEDLLGEIKTSIGLLAGEKGLKLLIEKQEPLPDSLYGDSIRIKQCLLNLLQNSVKYTSVGSVTLSVEGSPLKEDGRYDLVFKVSDTGRGIKEEDIPELFNAFQRLDVSVNRGVEGTGLGLAIVKNLIDEMGGRIEVESEVGVGTTFTIYISQKKGTKSKPAKTIRRVAGLNGLQVLVVDDTRMNLSLISKILAKKGIESTLISNGRDCLEDIKLKKYDLILLDHMMPEMNGVEVFEKMGADPGLNRDTPVVMLTANAMAGAEKEYLDIGFAGYLSKPINEQKLFEMIERLTN